MKKLLYAIFAVLLFVPYIRVHALEIVSKDSVDIPQTTTYNESVVAAGSVVAINGNVNGDLYCAGKSVSVTGTVTGDLICAAQNMHITGTVQGDLRIAAQSVYLSAAVGKNANVFAQQINVEPQSSISGELIFAGQQADIDGGVGSLYGGAERIRILGAIRGDTNVYVENLTVEESASLSGSLTYTGTNVLKQSEGAVVSGTVRHVRPEKTDTPERKSTGPERKKSEPAWPFNALWNIAVYLVFGIAAVALMPGKIQQVRTRMEKTPLMSFVWGLGAFVLLPLACLALLLTIIGIAFIPVLILLYILLIGFGRIVIGIVIGDAILRSIRGKRTAALPVQLLIGMPISILVYTVPYIGWIASWISMMIGFGAVLLSFSKHKA